MDATALITKFYTAFSRLDYKTMQDCYTPDAIFSDPAFGLLDQGKPHAMWQMLCTRAQNFSLTFSDIEIIDDEYATCKWTAQYIFSKTNRPVTNHVKAYMRIQDGKITEHSDAFNFYTWSRQALGLSGWLLGWTGFMQKKVQGEALKNLASFIHKNNL